MNKQELINQIKARKARSAWTKGVHQYALDLVSDLDLSEVCNKSLLQTAMLNGASNWHEYSYGGCALCYDGDIAERLCTPSELKRKRNGNLPPNKYESWLDVQTRALTQAANLVLRLAKCYC